MKLDRRGFLRTLSGGLAVAVIARLSIFSALAADKKAPKGAGKKAADVPLPAGAAPVAADDAVAGAIGYVADVSQVDKKKYPQFKSGQQCSKCALYTVSNEGWGKCQMIANGLVKAGGWCGSYSPKA